MQRNDDVTPDAGPPVGHAKPRLKSRLYAAFFHGGVRKWLFLLLLFSTLPALLSILLESVQLRREEIAQAETELLSFARHIAEMQTQAAQSTRQLLEGLARTPEVRQADVPFCSRLFKQIVDLNPMYGALHLVGTGGQLIASSVTGKPANFAHTKHFQDALRDKGFSTGEFLVGVTLKTPVFTFGYPVLDEQGETLGVLLTSYRLERYGDLFRFSSFPKDSFVGVVDHSGKRLYRYPDNPATPLGSFISPAALVNVQSASPTGLFSNAQSDGVVRVSAYQQVRLTPESPPYMSIVVGMPETAISARANALLVQNLALLLGSLGFVMFLTWIFGTRSIGRRIESLAQAAIRLGKGDLSVRVKPFREVRELSLLANAFNSMAQSLENDASTRVAAEKALQEYAHHLRVIFENSPLGMIRFSNEGVIKDCNSKFVEMMGSSREALIGFNTAKNSVPKMRECLRAALNGKVSVYEDVYTSVTGGKTLYLRVIFNPIMPELAPTEVIATLEDISERKRAEDALKESELRFRKLFDNSPAIAVQGYDQDRTVIYWNEASVKFYGYSAEEALGKKLEDLIIPPFMRSEVVEAVKAWTRDGVDIPAGEMQLMRKDGALIPVFSSHVMQTGARGGKDMYCVDIDLSDLVKTRQELQSAKESAEAANRAKTEFLANMSHEIRTPLNGVMGMLQLLGTTALEAEQQEYVDAAIQSSQRLTSLLSDILDISRVEAGVMTLRPAPFEIESLKKSILGLFSHAAKEKNLSIDFLIDDAIPRCLVGDQARLLQILFNLTGNAIKFTDAGGIRIEASLLPNAGGEGVRVLFMVTDTGIGIPDDMQRDIFEPFVQADGSYTRRYQGAGLGLAIVKRLVLMMQGELTMESAEGKGSTVYASIPFKLPSGRLEAPQAPPDAPPATGSRLTALVVEDERVNLELASRMLQKFGHATITARNGQEAVQQLTNNKVDLILMDVQMPVVNGVDATKAIRAGKAGPSNVAIPIIAMTAYAMVGDRERILAAGMDDYIAKPLEMRDLRDVIDKTMEKRRALKAS